MKNTKSDLEMDCIILHKWFNENHMVLNPGKCHYVVISDNDPSRKIVFNDNEIAGSNEEKRMFFYCSCKNKSLYLPSSENLAIKLSSKIPIPLLPTSLNVNYWSK